MKNAVVIVLLVVLGLGLITWRVVVRVMEQADSAFDAAVATPVSVVPVTHETIRDIQAFTGTLLPKSQFVVSPKTPGRLDSLKVDIGDEVKSGQLIATLDDAEYARLVEQAQAELDVAQANVDEVKSTLDVARREFDRSKTLSEKGIASPSELDTAEAEYKTAEAKLKVALAQVDQRQAALDAAKVRFGYTRITPEWPDADRVRVVGERFADQGVMLRANDSIVSLLDIHTLTGVVHVTEREYPKIHVGQKVTVTTDAFANHVFEGRVVRVAPLVKETSREARIEVEIPNADRLLKPGMFVRAEIEFEQHDNATVVPSDAIVRRQNKQGVFLVDTDKENKDKKIARFVPVEMGIVQGDQTEILRPALEGLVITLGNHLLEDGSAIRLPQQAPAGGDAGAKATGGEAK